MHTRLRPLAAAAVILLAADSIAAELDVMTQNQYLGADLTPIITAPDPLAFNAAVIQALQNVAGNLPAQRVARLAALIAERAPHLVGLQEAFVFTCVDASPSDGAGCEDPTVAGAFSDHLQGTLAALGDHYVEAARVTNLDLSGIPFLVNGTPALLGVTDRDVILARSDIAADVTPVDFSVYQPQGICLNPSADGCNYLNVAEIDFLGSNLRVERGFVAVDAAVDGASYRVANTHLEVREIVPGVTAARFFQAAQAFELIQTLTAVTPPGRTLLVVGDMNSDPRDRPVLGGQIVPPYLQFAAAGFTDVWLLRPGAVSGASCCQDGDLGNHQSALDERIDLILARQSPRKVFKARVLGATVADKTWPPGLGIWPSDHASVAARLEFD